MQRKFEWKEKSILIRFNPLKNKNKLRLEKMNFNVI